MTLKEFFRKARRGRNWKIRDTLTDRTVIRCALGDCPLAAVTGTWSPSGAADKLGWPIARADKIADAADSPRSPHRAWLLKHLKVAS